MPRNPQGLYTLPAGNPVVPNTLIESAWANTTMDDVATALTNSLPRDGSAPMTGPLTLQAAAPTQPRHAVSKGYLESFLAYATGMPIGSLLPIAGATVPSGFLLCNGQAVSRTTYPDLFAAIGTIYGSGDGSTTFNVPDLRDWFIRGKGDTRPIGSTQAAAFASHTHPLQDPGHIHAASQTAHDHTITTGGHGHGVNDPGHAHTAPFYNHNDNGPLLGNANGVQVGTLTTSAVGTGISIQAVGNLGGSADARQPAVTVNWNATGASIGVAGGAETVPQNIAMNYVIKAVNDPGSTVALTGIASSDDNCISIDNTLPTVPMLDIHSNVAFGLVKLDGSSKIPPNLLPSGSQNLLGYWDASTGLLPTGTFSSGDTYIISVAGVLTVYDPVTLTQSPQSVNVGDFIQYITGSPTNPTGWYHVVPSTTVTAGQVQFTPDGTVAATNVQAAIAEVDAEKVSKSGDTMTGNLNFSGNALRIRGDFSNATVANRWMFQTSTANAGSVVQVIPNGSGSFGYFGASNSSDTTNFNRAMLGMSSTAMSLESQAAGTGTFLPMTFYTGGLERMRIDTSGEITANGTQVAGPSSLTRKDYVDSVGSMFCKNKLFNGEVTRINQRGVANWAAVANGAYGYDRWKKIDASSMTQIIEAGNFRPNTVHTLSGIGVTTQQITSPPSGNWTLPNIPITATNVQLEEGSVATPFEVRPLGFELGMCQRYYLNMGGVTGEVAGTAGSGQPVTGLLYNFPVQMRAVPSVSVTPSGGINITSIYATPSTQMVNAGGLSIAAGYVYAVFTFLTADAEL